MCFRYACGLTVFMHPSLILFCFGLALVRLGRFFPPHFGMLRLLLSKSFFSFIYLLGSTGDIYSPLETEILFSPENIMTGTF